MRSDKQIATSIANDRLRGLRNLARMRDAIYKFRDEDPDVFSDAAHIDSAILLLDQCLKDIRESHVYWKKRAAKL